MNLKHLVPCGELKTPSTKLFVLVIVAITQIYTLDSGRNATTTKVSQLPTEYFSKDIN